jgi:hypothetical protein
MGALRPFIDVAKKTLKSIVNELCLLSAQSGLGLAIPHSLITAADEGIE